VPVRTANVNSLNGLGAESVRSSAKLAAWPSMGCDTPRSRLYSCMLPLTRNAPGAVLPLMPISTTHFSSGETR